MRLTPDRVSAVAVANVDEGPHVDGVDADVAGQAVGLRRLVQGHVDRGRPRPRPHDALGAVGRRAAQVVEAAFGERHQSLEAHIPEHLGLEAQDLARGQFRHLPVGLVDVRSSRMSAGA